jgi:uncharacterized protein
MIILAAFCAGLLFGLGLIVSQMFNPAKVIGFLDISGAWDPSLAFVMVGAIAVGLVAFNLAAKRNASLLGEPLVLPGRLAIDRRLVLGSVMFGVGWGAAGFCPGPGLVGLGSLEPKAVAFVAAMLAGMAIFEMLNRRTTSPD